MSAIGWQPEWIKQHAREHAMTAYRLVETQYVAATMRLVDSMEEQSVLEQLLEQSKPPLPNEAQSIHYLLAAPFRYVSPTASRFRSAHRPGIWYGADHPYAACAEVAHWRQKFLLDSDGLESAQLSTELSMFQAHIQGIAIELMEPPWVQRQVAWTHPSDYSQTQQLGAMVQDDGRVVWICYSSVRAPQHACAAVFKPSALSMLTRDEHYEQWHCLVTQDKVTMTNGVERFDLSSEISKEV